MDVGGCLSSHTHHPFLPLSLKEAIKRLIGA